MFQKEMILINFIKKFFLIVFLLLIFSINVEANDIQNENLFFTSDLCLECREVNDNVYEFCQKNNITIINIDKDNFENYKDLISKYNVPLLVYNGEIYSNVNQINSFVEGKSLLILSFLGFFDGFNPCAISILMIFISLLISLNKQKKVLIIGTSFIIGEVLTNFLLGLGLIKLTDYLSGYSFILNIIYILALVICLFIFTINCIDIYNGFSKKNKINNQLSNNNKLRISSIINKYIGSKSLGLISFLMGMIIALLEFGCTGQIYLPSILYMDNNILYLLIYNLFFALPLIIFLFLSYILNKPERIKSFVMENSYLLKIIFNIIILFLSLNIINKLI